MSEQKGQQNRGSVPSYVRQNQDINVKKIYLYLLASKSFYAPQVN